MRAALGLLLAATILTGFGCPLAAQYRADMRVGISAPAISHDASHLLPIRVQSHSHWKEGFVIGTVIGGLLVLPLACLGAEGPCPITLRAVVGSLAFGSLIGGVPGALIGGLFPKGENHDSTTAH